MKNFLLITLLMLNVHLYAQVIRQPLSVHYASAGVYSVRFSDVFCGTANQASLASLKTTAFAVYGEKRFMLDELKGFTAIFALPSASGSFGLQTDYFGSSSFNETQLGLAYARKVGQRVDVGVKFNYHTVRVPVYGSASAVNFEGGAVFHLTDQIHSAIHVYNPTAVKLGKNGLERLASIYRFGIGYEASEKLLVLSEVVKVEDRSLGVVAGLQYSIHPRLFIRTGISTANTSSYFSLGINTSFCRVDFNTAYHPQLGFTPGILLLMNLKKSEQD